jgi:hypothetical protein
MSPGWRPLRAFVMRKMCVPMAIAGYVYAISGHRSAALEILNDFEKRSNQESSPAVAFSQIYAGLGDCEQALAWIDAPVLNERRVSPS